MNQTVRGFRDQELTQEVRLTESMPDVGRVIGGWGQVILRSKEWQGSRMAASGGVMAWVLYAPEDGTEPKTVNAWLPFQLKWDGAETDREGLLRVQPILRFVDGRNLSARKILVRAGISCLCEGLSESRAGVYISPEVPADVELLRRSYPMQLPREAGEKTFTMEETLMPSGDGIRQVLAYSLEPEITEKRVTGDKLLVRGLARVHLLCVTVEGSLLGKDLEAAFSQLAELDRPYEADARSDVLMAVTGLEVDMSEENLALKASLTAQYVISERTVLELVEDAFSPRREVGLRQEELYLPAVLDEWAQRLTPQVDFGDQIAEPLDVRFWPGYPQIIRGIDRAEVEVPGRFQLLGRDAEGVLRCISGSWTGSVDLGADDTSQMDGVVQPCADIQLLHSVGALEARCEIGLQVTALARRGLPMITALELGPEREADPQRPSLILCRAGARGLWDIARTTGSSVSAIMAANGLTEEPSDRRMLLIPVS